MAAIFREVAGKAPQRQSGTEGVSHVMAGEAGCERTARSKMLRQERFSYGPGIAGWPLWQGRGPKEENAPVKSSLMESCVKHWKEREGHWRDLSRERT